MIAESQVRALVEEKINQEGGTFIVEVVVKPGNKIVVLLDNDNGLSINECVEVSRHIEGSLDREVEDYELEVSSPGLDQPFKVNRQYQKYVGKQVAVVTKDGKKIQGQLTFADKNKIVVEEKAREKVEGKKGKQLVVRNHELAYNLIKETKIVISFN